MRKLLIILFTVSLLIGCGSKDLGKKTNLERYTANLVQLYPNFETNEMAEKAIKDSIVAMSKNTVGKNAILLDSVMFRFDGLKEGKRGKCALFVAEPFMFVDNQDKDGNNKSISVTINISAFGRVDDSIASKLDGKKTYIIKGKVHSVDFDNTLCVFYMSSINAINFGTYILDNMVVSETQQAKGNE